MKLNMTLEQFVSALDDLGDAADRLKQREDEIPADPNYPTRAEAHEVFQITQARHLIEHAHEELLSALERSREQ